MHDKVNDLVMATITGKLSRREVLKRAAALGLSAPLIGALVRVSDVAAQDNSQLEVFSWWTSGGEVAALQALFDAFSAEFPDVEIVNAAIAGAAGSNAIQVLQTRLAGNNPPDSWQVHVGHELIDLYVTSDYCLPISDIYESEGWNDVYPAGLVEQVTHEGDKYAVPVGVHRGNTLWYNKQVMADNGIEVGETMSIEEWVAAADTLKAAGVPAFVIGDKDGFVIPHNFEAILAATAGGEGYKKLFAEGGWDAPEVTTAIETLGKMMEYLNEDHGALTWDGAIAQVIEGKGGFSVMGDWAYGEVVKKGAQDQIGYVSSPGTAGTFVLVVDCFTLPKDAPHADNAVGWLKVIGGKAAQEAFNPLKGSIPARTDVDKTKFSDYHQWSMNSFANDTLVPSSAHGSAANPGFQQAINEAANFFAGDLDVEAFQQALVDGFAENKE